MTERVIRVVLDPATKSGAAAIERDLSGIDSKAKGAQSSVSELKSLFAAAFPAIGILAAANALKNLISSTATYGDEITKASQKSGIGTTAVQELAYAAKSTDVNLESLSLGVRQMQTALSQAASGGKDAQRTLAALGVSIAGLAELTPDKQFERLGDAISRLKDPADRSRAAVELFGRSGAELLPLFSQGAAGIEKLRREAGQLNQVLSESDIEQLAATDTALKRLDASWTGLWRTLATKATPAATEFFDALRRGIGGSTDVEQRLAGINEQIARMQMLTDQQSRGARGAASSLVPVASIEAQIKQLEALRNLILNPTHDEGRKPTRSPALSDVAPGYADAAKDATQYADALTEITASGNYLAGSLQNLTPYLAQERDITLQNILAMGHLSQAEKDATAAEQQHQRLLQEAKSIYESTRTPLEQYGDQIQRLNELLDDGAFGTGTQATETYTRAVKQAQDALDTMPSSVKRLSDSISSGISNAVRDGKLSFESLTHYIAAQIVGNEINDAIKAFSDRLAKALNPSGSASFGTLLGGGLATLLGFADGGRPPVGRASIVGERGPEIFIPDRAGTIYPNIGNISSPASSNGGSDGGRRGDVKIEINQHIDARGATVDAIKLLPAAMKGASDNAVDRVRKLVKDGRL